MPNPAGHACQGGLIRVPEPSDMQTGILLTKGLRDVRRALRRIFDGDTYPLNLSRCVMTELKSALNRELTIGKTAYKLTITPQGFKLVLKGKRNGVEIAWRDLVSGDAAMAVALRASLHAPSAKRRANPQRRYKQRAKQADLH